MKTSKNLISLIALLTGSVLSASTNANASPSIQCWGNNAEGQTIVPQDIVLSPLPANPLEVRTARGATCILGSQGTVTCRGIPMVDIPKLEALSGVKTFSLSSGGACAVVGTAVQCFSAMGDTSFETIPALTNPKTVAVSGISVCALDDTGVKCWGGNDTAISNVPTLAHPTKVVAGASDFCALNDTGVVCWGDGQNGIESIPTTLSGPTDLFLGASFACALDKNGVECWGNSFSSLPAFPKPVAGAQYVAGQNHVCELANSAVQCWGDNSLAQLAVPGLSRPKKLFADSVGNQTCALDDSGLVCWGEDQAGQSSLGDASSIVAGFGNTCAAVHGKMECWGTGTKSINVTLPITDAYQMALGSNFACAVNVGATSQTSCWGDEQAIVMASPQLPLLDFTQGSQFGTAVPTMTAGFDHGCVNVPGQGLNCAGNNDFGQVKLPAGLNPVPTSNAVSAGGSHTCAIDSVHGLLCWGKNEFGESTVPKTLKNPRQVSAGFSHTCALDDNGVTCWGRGTEGQTKVPPLSHPRFVQAGGYHTCATDDNGLSCWGDNSFGQSTLPTALAKSKIANVSTGLFHTCVVTQ
jgi:hypothetical protein